MPFFSRHNAAEAAQELPVLCARIRQLMQLSKYDRAIQILEGLLKQDGTPGDFSCAELDILYQYYGECLVQSSRLPEAVEVISRGIRLEPEAGCRCRETLEELVIPSIEKHIIEGASIEEAVQLIRVLQEVGTDSANKAIKGLLSAAGEAYKKREFQRAISAYESILPLAQQQGCLSFEDILRAGDSCVKSNQLNKAWKLYKTAQNYADTFHKKCRLHKKIADLLVIRNQDWHAILHFLVALQAVPSDRGARSKLQKTLKKLGLEEHTNIFLQLNAEHSDHKQLEISLMNLKKRLKAS